MNMIIILRYLNHSSLFTTICNLAMLRRLLHVDLIVTILVINVDEEALSQRAYDV